MIKKLFNDESGQGVVEYSYILSLIIIAVIGGIIIFGESLVAIYEHIRVVVKSTL